METSNRSDSLANVNDSPPKKLSITVAFSIGEQKNRKSAEIKMTLPVLPTKSKENPIQFYITEPEKEKSNKYKMFDIVFGDSSHYYLHVAPPKNNSRHTNHDEELGIVVNEGDWQPGENGQPGEFKG